MNEGFQPPLGRLSDIFALIEHRYLPTEKFAAFSRFGRQSGTPLGTAIAIEQLTAMPAQAADAHVITVTLDKAIKRNRTQAEIRFVFVTETDHPAAALHFDSIYCILLDTSGPNANSRRPAPG
ncbi:hypothetical protein QFZ54_003307 [Sphingomonas faeni]|nr:hypothetical protein [Sphingomonas faeni]